MFASIKTASFFAIALKLSGVSAHGFVQSVTIDGVVFPGANPFAAADPASIVWPQTGGNGPLVAINTDEIACGRITGPPTVSAPAAAGAKVEFDWAGAGFAWPAGDKGTGPLNHHGPVMTYLAKCAGPCKDAVPTELSWFKFQEEGRTSADAVPGVWGSDTLALNDNKVSMTLPAGLASGEYIMRHEILALHNAMNGDPQFYPMCSNLDITGDGSAPLPAKGGAKFPGAYDLATDPNLKINIFDPASLAIKYVAPGPRPITGKAKRDAFACNFARSAIRDSAACV